MSSAIAGTTISPRRAVFDTGIERTTTASSSDDVATAEVIRNQLRPT